MIGSLARNAPLGVEIVHCKCSLEIASNNLGNNSMLHLEHLLDGNVCILNAAIYYLLKCKKFEKSVLSITKCLLSTSMQC